MTTIESLPLECLVLILELVAADPSTVPFIAMATVSLVARRWREPAQALMWKVLELEYPGDATSITESPACGKFRTASVTVFSDQLQEEETLGGLLGKLRGLETVAIYHCDDEDDEDDDNDWSPSERLFDVEWLNLPSLADVKDLTFDLPVVEVSPGSPQPAFHLRKLRLDGSSANSPAVIHTLIASSSSTLLSLTLNHMDDQPSLQPTLLAALPLATHLTSLTLLPLKFPSLGPVLAALSSFTTLTVHLSPDDDILELGALLAAFDPPLQTLELRLGYTSLHVRNETLPVLTKKIGHKAWSGLKCIHMLDDEQGEVLGTDAGKTLVKRCRDEGVSVKFGWD